MSLPQADLDAFKKRMSEKKKPNGSKYAKSSIDEFAKNLKGLAKQLDFTETPEEAAKKLDKAYPNLNTRKQRYWVLSHFHDSEEFKKLAYDKSQELNPQIKNPTGKQLEKEQAKYVPYKELRARAEVLKPPYQRYRTRWRNYLLAMMLSHLEPIRPSDLASLVYQNHDDGKQNHISVSKRHVVIQKYKQKSKSVGKRVIPLDERFMEIIRVTQGLHRRTGFNAVFQSTKSGTGHFTADSLSKLIKQLFGGVGASTIRNIYVSWLYDQTDITPNQKEVAAKRMGHSQQTAENKYTKYQKIKPVQKRTMAEMREDA